MVTIINESRRSVQKWLERNSYLVNLLAEKGINLSTEKPIERVIGTVKEPELVSALLSSLDHAPDSMAQASYVNLLARTSTPFDINKIIDVFDSSDVYAIRAAIIRTLANTGNTGTFEFLCKLIMDPNYGDYSSLAAGYTSDTPWPQHFLPLLRKHYDRFPYSALHSFYKAGEAQDLEFLKQQLGKPYNLPADVQKEYFKLLDKTIAKLEKKFHKVAAK